MNRLNDGFNRNKIMVTKTDKYLLMQITICKQQMAKQSTKLISIKYKLMPQQYLIIGKFIQHDYKITMQRSLDFYGKLGKRNPSNRK